MKDIITEYNILMKFVFSVVVVTREVGFFYLLRYLL